MSAYTGAGTPQLFKYLYLDNGWRNLVELKHPWLAMVPKGEAATPGIGGSTSAPMGPGSGLIFTWNYSNPQSASMTYGTAVQQQDSLTTGTQLMCQLGQFYAAVRFAGKDLAASQNNLAAFMQSKKWNFDNAIKDLANQVDLALHRAGNGIIGTISDVTGTVITLSNTTAIQQFQFGMVIASVSTFPVDGTAPTAGPGLATVQKVATSYANGQLTVALSVDNPAGFDTTTNKYVVKAGNALGFSATNTQGNIIGMRNFIPISGDLSGSDNFLSSINRNVDKLRLSGLAMTSGGRKYQEAVAEANAVCVSIQGAPDIILANPLDLQKASIELGANARYEEFKTGAAGFDSLIMGGPAGGKLRWVADPNMDVGTLRGMTLDTWKLYSMRAIPHVVDEDGLTLRKDNGADMWQVLMRAWPQQVCYEPYGNWVVTGF